jgi:hypothetical protein
MDVGEVDVGRCCARCSPCWKSTEEIWKGQVIIVTKLPKTMGYLNAALYEYAKSQESMLGKGYLDQDKRCGGWSDGIGVKNRSMEMAESR